jgi:MoxR-like ATPase
MQRDYALQINRHLDALQVQFVSRRALLEVLMLGMMAREHVLLIGPPGTGKSAAVQAMAASLKARSFEYLIGRFTEPSELFGALDLNALKEGRLEPVTEGMLPEAEIAFLDEIFLGSTAIINTLLKILNERTYRRGQFSMRAPLISCIAASNDLPSDPQLSAFADRFLLTMFVEPVEEGGLVPLLQTGWNQFGAPDLGIPPVDKSLLDTLYAASLRVDLSSIREAYAHIIRKLRLLGVTISDRKAIKGQKAIAAAAVLRGAHAAGAEDLWPIVFLVQDKVQQQEARELLGAELAESLNPVLSASVSQATYGLTAHAADLAGQCTLLLGEEPGGSDRAQREAWLVRLESLLVRIDAAFSLESLPQHLGEVRARIVHVLEAPGSTPVSPARLSAE